MERVARKRLLFRRPVLMILLFVVATLFFITTAVPAPPEEEQMHRGSLDPPQGADVPPATLQTGQVRTQPDDPSFEFGMYAQPENGACNGEINIITQFPILPEVLPELGDGVKDVKAIEKDRNYAKEAGPLHRQRRQEEYFDTLRKNLRNPHVKRIHLLLEKASDIDFIRSQGVPDECGKLRPVELGRWMHYRDAFEYANRELSGELCMVMNADIYLAKGFQLATPDLFRSKAEPHVYVLARWEGPSVYCVEKPSASCTTRANVGSYDAFLFLSPLPLSKKELQTLDFQQNIWGAENAVLSLLIKNGMTTSNPCELLQVGHNHCDTYFRPQQGLHDGKYRVAGGTGKARLTRQL